MATHNLFKDLPTGKSEFHSAVLTTYSCNIGHFENQVLPHLRQRNISSINVLADAGQFEESVEYSAASATKLGEAYSIDCIAATGAFHPKLTFLLGDRSLLLLLGSGNITGAGHGKNLEIFSGFYADEARVRHLPLLCEAWSYISGLAGGLSGFSRNRIIDELPRYSRLLQKYDGELHRFHPLDDVTDAALLYNTPGDTILAQLDRLIDDGDRGLIDEIIIISPFYDADGQSITNLRELSSAESVSVKVFMATDTARLESGFILPPVNMAPSPEISFHYLRPDDDTVKWSQLLHAKIFILRGGGVNYCVVGSANCTTAGLGRKDGVALNEEFSVLYKANMADRDFVRELGIDSSSEEIERAVVSALDRRSGDGGERKSDPVTVRILSAEYIGGRLALTVDQTPASGNVIVAMLDGYNMAVGYEGVDQSMTLTTDLPDDAIFVRLYEGDRPISNTAVIKRVDKLERTGPSREYRALNMLRNYCDTPGVSIMKIARYIDDIFDELEPESSKKSISSGSATDVGRSSRIVKGVYDPEFDKGLVENGVEDILRRRVNTLSDLAECFNKAIRARTERLRQSVEDEEEAEESSEKQIKRDEKAFKKVVPGLSTVSKFVIVFIKRYNKMLEASLKAFKSGKTLDESDLRYYVISLHLVLRLVYFDEIKGHENEIESLRNSVAVLLGKTVNNFAVIAARCSESRDSIAVSKMGAEVAALSLLALYMPLKGNERRYSDIVKLYRPAILNILLLCDPTFDDIPQEMERYLRQLYEDSVATEEYAATFYSVNGVMRFCNEILNESERKPMTFYPRYGYYYGCTPLSFQSL